MEMEQNAATNEALAAIKTDPVTGLAVVVFNHPAKVEDQLTPDRFARILIEQEACWTNQLRRVES